MAQKNLKYYRSLKYDVVVKVVDVGEHKEYFAYTRELDPDLFHGIGGTIEEAVQNLEQAKASLFADFLEDGLPIPEPWEDMDELPSGKFLVRVSPQTHRRLIQDARRNRQSLNAYVNSILVASTSISDLINSAKDEIIAAAKASLQKVEQSWIGAAFNRSAVKTVSNGESDYANAA